MKQKHMPDRSKTLSFHPLKLDEIIKATLAVPASQKLVMPKRSKSKSASKSRA